MQLDFHHGQLRLFILAGLPGAGKTTVARALGRAIGALHIRVDTIEHAIRESGVAVVSLDDAGYRAGYAIAEDNLKLGHSVIADSVNPLPITREAWRNVARRAHVAAVEIEVVCSDPDEHRRRVETRLADMPGFRLPTWQDVVMRDYRPWDRDHLVVDTAGRHVEDSVAALKAALSSQDCA